MTSYVNVSNAMLSPCIDLRCRVPRVCESRDIITMIDAIQILTTDLRVDYTTEVRLSPVTHNQSPIDVPTIHQPDHNHTFNVLLG